MAGRGSIVGNCWFTVAMDGSARNEHQWSAYDELSAEAMRRRRRGKRVTVTFPPGARMRNNEVTVTLTPSQCVCVTWE